MSNLDSARSAIEAEIEHAKQGLSYYQARIESLERALHEVARIDGVASHHASLSGTAPKKRGPKPKNAVQGNVGEPVATGNGKKGGKQKSKKGAASSGGNELPFTGGDYWPNLITAEPKSAKEVLDAAIASLGFTPTKEQVQKLTGRMTFALNTLVKTNAIRDSGRGRERRFFKD
jgi:hypothetical protein